MISSQGSQSTDFDILNSQKNSDTDSVHVIKINKKIQDTGFTKAIKPTELSPEPVLEKDEIADRKNIHTDKFVVPKEITDYLDLLIVKKKLPLRTLKFDVEFSRSKEEVERHLREHAEKIGNIEKQDLERMLALLGVTENPQTEEKEISENILEQKNTEEVVQEVPQPLQTNTNQNNSVDLVSLRESYTSLYVNHLQKLKSDIQIYKMMMSQLGTTKSMPVRPEPTELIMARNEYYDARKTQQGGVENNIKESGEKVSSEILLFPIKTKDRLNKAISFFDNYVNSTQLSEALLNADSQVIGNIIDPNKYDGMRTEEKTPLSVSTTQKKALIAEPEKKEEEVVTKVSALASIKEKLSKVTTKESDTETNKPVQEVLPQKKENKVLQNRDISDSSQEIKQIPEVKVEIIQSSDNFIPKKAQQIQEKPKNKFATTKVEKKPAVDNTVAQTVAVAQNVFPTEFEDKKLEVHHGFPGNQNGIKVFYGGKEIASGLVGGKVVINKEFKSGFLLADTQEERALKHAHTIIKTLKPVK